MGLAHAQFHTPTDREVLKNWKLSLRNTVINEMLMLSEIVLLSLYNSFLMHSSFWPVTNMAAL